MESGRWEIMTEYKEQRKLNNDQLEIQVRRKIMKWNKKDYTTKDQKKEDYIEKLEERRHLRLRK